MDAFMRFALNVREIVRKDPVLVVAIVLAIISCAAVPPDAAYAEYVDLRTIGMLFSLMAIMAGLSRLGVFRIACRHLLSAVRGPRRLALALTLLAFFSSMLITNDVALVTFVPFALLALRTLDSPRHACFTVVMMTIAANLGSMLTPIGNPQNLYLYSTSHMALTDFLLLMLPYAAAALVLLVGVGSVGTRAWIALLAGKNADDPLILQAKEASESVVERFWRPAPFASHAERVVQGQRLVQSTSDILLGWTKATAPDGTARDYYVRQLWNGKGSIDLERIGAGSLESVARLCAHALAHAHARTGDELAISAYLDDGDAFEDALWNFSQAYADQNEADYEVFMARHGTRA